MTDYLEIIQALQSGGAVVYPLIIIGVIALVITIDKSYVYRKFMRLPTHLNFSLEHTTHHAQARLDWQQLESLNTALSTKNYYAQFTDVVLKNRAHPIWWIQSRAAEQAQSIEQALSKSLWVLETIVTAAPLLGLLGTIGGMMHSFQLFGGSGLVDPGGVTGGVAQALIATAIGLLIAILALFAFNFFSKLQSQALDDLERIGTHLIDIIQLEAESK